MIQLINKLLAYIVPNKIYHLIIYNPISLWERTNELNSGIPIIIGTVDEKENIDFDCEKYIEKFTSIDTRNERRNGTGEIKYYFENYMDEQIPCSTPEKSFISLLNSKGIFPSQLSNQKIIIFSNEKI